MVTLKSKDFLTFLLVSVFFNLFFYFNFYFEDNLLYSGVDSVRLHYASKFFTSESFKQGVFPIFTDKMYGGYPIFFDLERGLQNIFNVTLIYFLGPFDSFKVLFFGTFIIGAVSLYLLLKKYFEISWQYLFLCHLLYFYSFFNLLHLQHQNYIFVVNLFPVILYFSQLYLENKRTWFILLISFLYNFIFTFGALQMVFMVILGNLLFLLCFNHNLSKSFKASIVLISASVLFSLPGIYYFYELFSFSERQVFHSQREGSFNLNYLAGYVFPSILGNNDYRAGLLSSIYTRHEFILYFSFSGLLTALLTLSNIKFNNSAKLFAACVLILFLLANFYSIAPFDYFRYWVRMVFLINFSLILLIASYFSQIEKFEYNKKFFLYVLLLITFVALNFLNSEFRFIFISIFDSIKFELLAFLLFGILTVISFRYPKIVLSLMLLELGFFLSFYNFNLTAPTSVVDYFTNSTNNIDDLGDHFSLFRQGKSFSGYSALVPNISDNLKNELFLNTFTIENYLYLSLISIIFYSIFLLLHFKYKNKF
jgi:hypothetical protein